MKSVMLMGALAGTVLWAVACSVERREPDEVPTAKPTWSAAMVDTLLRHGREDQNGREAIMTSVVNGDTTTLMAWIRADSSRTAWLRRAVAERGWPTSVAAGDSAQQAAWLILQHSPDTAWQAMMLPTLEALAERRELPADGVAMLTDRVLARRGKPQRYGSQFDLRDGRLVPAPVEDLATIDARRAAVGLPPMTEYVEKLAQTSGMRVEWPPAGDSTRPAPSRRGKP